MSTVTVQANQTIYDIAIAQFGSVEGVFNILRNNRNLDLEADLQVGQRIKIAGDPIEEEVVDFFARQENPPASGQTNPPEPGEEPDDPSSECQPQWSSTEW